MCEEIRIMNSHFMSLDALMLSHHYLSEEMMLKFTKLGINVDLSEEQDSETAQDERYITASE